MNINVTKVNENIRLSESNERLTHAQTTSTRPIYIVVSLTVIKAKTRPGIKANHTMCMHVYA